MKLLEILMDLYVDQQSIAVCRFELLNRMLDIEYVKERINLLNSSEIYIYGAGCLGVYFYRAIKDMIKIISVIDQNTELALRFLDIPIVGPDKLKINYNGQKIIITSIQFYNEIYNDLLEFVPKSQILFLGELLGGILK